MTVSPIGASVSDDIARRRRESMTYRAEDDRLAGFEQLARIVIMRRAELGLTQEALARRMGGTVTLSRESRAASTPPASRHSGGWRRHSGAAP